MTIKNNIWVIIPAAGVGRRMGSATPKQYLLLNDKPVLEHTLNIFMAHDAVSEIVVAVSKEDEYWATLSISNQKPVLLAEGGKERSDSVLNGLKYIESQANDDDWVLVHDAARPCLRKEDLSLLIDSLSTHSVGGILAVPVRDTMKRAVAKTNLINKTVDRDDLWHALTPQMFRYKMLKDALEMALRKDQEITDEASAIELAGFQPKLIEGHADNIKITRPEDLELAAFFLRQAHSGN
ncbi:MAG: 2-C-methyl-D-erythritol 4-phosphate cytidylyltransferase [Gammaproteobacteria bacterium]|nr:2-C-methyl-D-erythritol 4-phosphate cytidylyltransferase [Gammaproteobacteria bacterium]